MKKTHTRHIFLNANALKIFPNSSALKATQTASHEVLTHYTIPVYLQTNPRHRRPDEAKKKQKGRKRHRARFPVHRGAARRQLKSG